MVPVASTRRDYIDRLQRSPTTANGTNDEGLQKSGMIRETTRNIVIALLEVDRA